MILTAPQLSVATSFGIVYVPLLLTQKAGTVGQEVIAGGSVSFKVIVKVQVCPAPVFILTVVVPIPKKEPEAGIAVTEPQVPEIVGNGKFTTEPHWPGLTKVIILAGQTRLQGSVEIA